mmetsp:Transcript_25623/g.77805  ORF Transcript_25623/g.77805 Transcript_25623/m.77805 type:complete len:200 (-) Transcript_25623:1014-1613(-)
MRLSSSGWSKWQDLSSRRSAARKRREVEHQLLGALPQPPRHLSQMQPSHKRPSHRITGRPILHLLSAPANTAVTMRHTSRARRASLRSMCRPSSPQAFCPETMAATMLGNSRRILALISAPTHRPWLISVAGFYPPVPRRALCRPQLCCEGLHGGPLAALPLCRRHVPRTVSTVGLLQVRLRERNKDRRHPRRMVRRHS